MNIVKQIIPFIAGAGLWCSCAAEKTFHPRLPPDVSINAGAGRGDWLLQTLRLEDATELLFIVDTGAPFTYLDTSLEAKLGKPIGDHIVYGYYGKWEAHEYRAPKIFLGQTPLQIGPAVVATDLKWLSDMLNCGRPTNRQVKGILGMDCLSHYCIQLDFEAGIMRFLEPKLASKTNCGKAFALRFSPQRPFVSENLLGMRNQPTLIDTGCNNDGQLNLKFFQSAANRLEISTNTTICITNKIEARLAAGSFGGENYPSLKITGNNEDNTIGLRFLARHLVTLDFPKRTMFLKRVAVGPLKEDALQNNPPHLDKTMGNSFSK